MFANPLLCSSLKSTQHMAATITGVIQKGVCPNAFANSSNMRIRFVEAKTVRNTLSGNLPELKVGPRLIIFNAARVTSKKNASARSL